ncbi:fasciclin domain-containing protein [Flavobacterium sp. HJJ]|uniref:fasciclin domain-containing protein n=1 Tax=Flavobacterium sp. HJJ TaxID=2783792 RepID=UPI00188B96E8|nr:fasciclin domain-containing protein [Flavobacterium sp. HJJ]MBF4470716.1 fasciclin domain-containing protein [Flavobacterium sp. HJJ]
MIILNLNYKRLLVSLLTVALVSCSNPWDDRESNGDSNLDVTLNEAITSTAEVSQFGKLLTQTGYDKVLAASKTYTVFAPTNEALAKVDAAILNDAESLKKFVANHIALTSFSSVRKNTEDKILMLDDKYLIFKGSTAIGDAAIVTADHYAANGVFHIINKALTPKLNIWEYINANKGTSAMSAYLVYLKEFSIYKEDADAKAKAATGFLADSLSNSYLRNVYNLNNEKNSYTLFLMEDAGYNAEVTKMKPYLTKTSNDPKKDSTAIYSSYFTTRDLAFPKAYKKSELPKTLTSRFGVQFDVDQTQIVGEPIQLSNGIIYIMKKVDVKLSDRLVPTVIQGEAYTGYGNGSRSSFSSRELIDPTTGLPYNDIMAPAPGAAQFYMTYAAKDMFSTTYKVYWRAINDQLTVPISQRLQVGGKLQITGIVISVLNPLKDFGYKDVLVKDYNPFLLGSFDITQSGNIDLITLWAGTVAKNPLTIDYLKFVPDVKK